MSSQRMPHCTHVLWVDLVESHGDAIGVVGYHIVVINQRPPHPKEDWGWQRSRRGEVKFALCVPVFIRRQGNGLERIKTWISGTRTAASKDSQHDIIGGIRLRPIQ